MHELIMPAKLLVKKQLEQDLKQMFCVRICNFPALNQERNILKFLAKKIAGFNHWKLILAKDAHNLFTGSVLIRANDRETINELLLLHDYRLQG